MSLDKLVALIHSVSHSSEALDGWSEKNKNAFEGFWGGPSGKLIGSNDPDQMRLHGA